ncbi:PH domain-containing protein [Actinosynnema sp. NPDC020468]|uniref:PH domain-containing protein n=1 Tax=Actinosynnema sp. NPDC020468 TaxID=3154488 RepID=UPI003411427F
MNEPRAWSPKPPLVVVAWIGAAASLLIAVLSDEVTTKVLLGIATAVLTFVAGHASYVRPRLAVDDSGLTVGTLAGRQHLPWHEVKVRLVHNRRLGREVPTLELDWARGQDERLFVLTAADLGADPRDVMDVLHALRP